MLEPVSSLSNSPFPSIFIPCDAFLSHRVTYLRVRGGDSFRLDTTLFTKLEKLGSHLNLHTLEKAGHWLHVDNPTGLLRMMINQSFPGKETK